MSDVTALLDRWLRLGLIDRATAERIAAHERVAPSDIAVDGESPGTTASAAPGSGETGRGRMAEALGYVGAALAVGALGLLLFDLWDRLTTGGRLTVALLSTVVLAGAVVALHAVTSPAIQRLASVLSLGAVVTAAWSAGIVAGDLAALRSDDVAIVVALTGTVTALLAYLARTRPLPQLTLLVAVATTAETLVVRGPLPTDAFWYGLPIAAIGVVWVLLGDGGWLRPGAVATTAGGVTALIGLQVASFGELRTSALAAGLAVAAVAVVIAVVRGGSHHLAVGAVGLFVLLPQLVVDVAGDTIGAPATMFVVGALLVLVAVGLGRARREATDAEVTS